MSEPKGCSWSTYSACFFSVVGLISAEETRRGRFMSKHNYLEHLSGGRMGGIIRPLLNVVHEEIDVKGEESLKMALYMTKARKLFKLLRMRKSVKAVDACERFCTYKTQVLNIIIHEPYLLEFMDLGFMSNDFRRLVPLGSWERGRDPSD